MNHAAHELMPCWEVNEAACYEEGITVGRHMANRFLQHLGSGIVPVKNDLLHNALSAFVALYTKAKNTDYLLGQYDGFLARLSEFLVVSAYINNTGLCADNNFDPGKLPAPAGFC